MIMSILKTLKKWFGDNELEHDKPLKDTQSFHIQHDHTQGINGHSNWSDWSNNSHSSSFESHYSNSSDNFKS